MSRVSGAPADPHWLDRTLVESLHDDLLASHGGIGGIRDVAQLERVLAEPQRLREGAPESMLAEWAAAYAVGMAQRQPFVDGNKRAAFVSMAVFLRLNGFALDVPEPEAVLVAIDIATGAMPASDVAAWIRCNTTPILQRRGPVREVRNGSRGAKTTRKTRSA